MFLIMLGTCYHTPSNQIIVTVLIILNAQIGTQRTKPTQATSTPDRVNAYHRRNLSRYQRLTRWGQPHLLHQSILQGKMISSIDQQLIF